MIKKKIIIIGGGIMQIPLIEQAIKMNLQVYVADRNATCPGMSYDVVPVLADISDENMVVEEIKKILHQGQKVGVVGVVTVGTDFSRTVSRVGEYYRTTVLPYNIVQLLTDKSLMRKKLTMAGLPQPDFYIVKNEEEFFSCLQYFSQKNIPIVIKPVDSMGARGVKRLNLKGSKKDDLRSLFPDFHKTLKFSRKKMVIVEEMILGKEYSLDALAYSGEIIVTGIADRVIEFPPYFVETGHIIPSQSSKTVIQQLVEGFIKAIRVLTEGKEVSGAFKGDVFIDKYNRVVIGEVAGRLSGGYMSGYTYPLSSGVNLMQAAISLSLGHSPFPIEEKQLGVVIEKGIISQPGKVIEIKHEEKVKDCPGVEKVFIHVHKGDSVVNPENNLMKSANLIVRGRDYLQAKSYMNQALQVLQIITG